MIPAGMVLSQDARKLTRGRHHGSSQPVQVSSHRHHLQFTRLLKALWLQSRRPHEPEAQVRALVIRRVAVNQRGAKRTFGGEHIDRLSPE